MLPSAPPEDFPAQAAAVRRQWDLLASETLTTERRLVLAKVCALSLDAGVEWAPLPDQARLAFIAGQSAGDVTRAVQWLMAAGMIERVQAESHQAKAKGVPAWRFRLQTDPSVWQGVVWRVKSAADRRMMLETEAWLVARARPCPGRAAAAGTQDFPALELEPRFEDALAQARRQTALAEDDRLRTSATVRTAVPAPPVNVPEPRAGVPGADGGSPPWADLKALLRGPAAAREPGRLAAQPIAEPAARPGEACELATRPIPPVNNPRPIGCLANRQPGPGRVELATRPIGWPPHYASVAAGVRTTPTPTTHQPLQLPTEQVVFGGDVPGEKLGVVEGSQEDLRSKAAAVIGAAEWRKWERWWTRHLRLYPGEAWSALSQLATAVALARAGRGEPIRQPGRWFNARFRELAGILPGGGGRGK